MALFKVPGWSIPTAPIQEDSRRTSKKRKLSNTNQTEVVGDFDGQLKKLLHANSKSSQKSHGKNVKEEPSDQRSKDISGPSSVAGVARRKKKKGGKYAHATLPNQAEAPAIPLTDLQRKMKETLDGARFRYVLLSCLVS